jgi:signal transduction histidine kinase
MVRKHLSASVEVRVLTKSLRRCALCFALDGDLRKKEGQIGHVNRNAADDREQNLCFLCGPHHEAYDRRSRQAKGFTPGELRHHRQALYETVASRPELVYAAESAAANQSPSQTHQPYVAGLYERRLAMYEAARRFIAAVVSNLNISDAEASDYAQITGEAIFLFDDEVADYFSELYRKALRIRYIELQLNRAIHQDRRLDLGEEEMNLATWFSDQFDVLRKRLVPFMRA